MNTASKLFEGIIPAFYACYDDEGAISPEAVRALTRYFIDKGVHGLYVGGSSGECIYQSVEERKVTLEHVMAEAKGRIKVICHVACNNTQDSMELARHAESLGVDAIAAIPPIYFKLPEYAIAAYWNSMSQAAPNTNFIIYNIPQLAGVALTPALFNEMMKNPRVIGVKHSAAPIQDIQIFKSLSEGKSVVFNGFDEQFVGGFAMGADAGIGGTYGAMPELFLKMYDLLKQGRVEEARQIQYRVNEIITLLCSCHGNMYAVIKEVLRRREKLDIGSVRAPLVGIIEDDQAGIDKAVNKIDEAMEFIKSLD
jgi:N-acetylneuraminate lyase